MAKPVIVHADWDPEASVWVATSQDIRGLVTEADTMESLRAKLPGMILDLLEDTGVSDLPASSEIIARQRSADRGGIACMADYYRDVVRLLKEWIRIQTAGTRRSRNLVESTHRSSCDRRPQSAFEIYRQWILKEAGIPKAS